MPDGATTRCARHEGASARPVACERCGDFLCDACFGDSVTSRASDEPGEPTCSACREHTGSERLAWERPAPSLVLRHLLTTRDLLLEPATSAARMARGKDSTHALLYMLGAALCSGVLHALAGLLVSLVQPAAAGLASPSAVTAAIVGAVLLVVAPIAHLVAYGALTTIGAVVFHVSALFVGGRGSPDVSLRAFAYLAGLGIWALAPAPFFALVPFLAFVIWAPWLLLLAAVAVLSLAVVAREAFGIEGTRAWIPALTPLALAVSPFALVLAYVMVLTGLLG